MKKEGGFDNRGAFRGGVEKVIGGIDMYDMMYL